VMEARSPLRLAREAFDALGALPWGERARQELRATGEASQRRGPTPIDQLTPHELQIAHMVAEGLSNRQIAEQLYLSHRTVGAHLYRIFPKLGITSRSQMSGLLQSASSPELAG
jgi:DNA-binding NarL/FixJ family response regulator